MPSMDNLLGSGMDRTKSRMVTGVQLGVGDRVAQAFRNF